MKNLILISLLLVAGWQLALAQEFKTDVSQVKKIAVTQLYGKINLEEITGTQLIMSVSDFKKVEIPEKAKGLKPIGSGILPDNTNLGLNVETEGTVLKLKGAIKQSMDAEYTIKVPKGIAVMIDYHNPFTYGDIDVANFGSELEIKTLSDDINLKNVTGPLVLHSISGNINVVFGTINQNAPISISSISGDVDLTMPSDTKASLVMNTMQGQIFSDFDVKLSKEAEDGLSFIGGGKNLDGNINGGGVEINLKVISNNIYIRKAK